MLSALPSPSSGMPATWRTRDRGERYNKLGEISWVRCGERCGEMWGDAGRFRERCGTCLAFKRGGERLQDRLGVIVNQIDSYD